MKNTKELIVPRVSSLDEDIGKLKQEREDLVSGQSDLTKAYYKIFDYKTKQRYSHSMKEIFKGYEQNILEGYYVSATTKDIINNCLGYIEILYEAGYRE
jgi:hypothetical protein